MTAGPLDLFRPAPAERLAALRILFGLYGVIWSLIRVPAHLDYVDQAATRWEPVGLLAPFGDPLPSAAVVALAIGTPLLGLAYVAGWRYSLSGPAFAAALAAVATLGSSWGTIFHTENLMVLHVGIVALAPGAADALAVGRRHRPHETGARYGWPIRLATLVLMLAYLLAGIAKLRGAGVGWGSGETLRNLVAHDNLRKALLGDTYSPVGNVLVAHAAWLFPAMAVAALAVELGAWMTLVGRRWRAVWALTAWLFHVGVLALMAILFPYQLSGVAFAPLFRVERLRPMRWLARSVRTQAARADSPLSPNG
jgi:hypothetical protein